MESQRQDKTDLGQLRRLEGHAAHPVPAVVGGAAGVKADGEHAEVHVVEKQGGQHQPPGHHGMQWPGAGQGAVIHCGEDDGQHDAQKTGNDLHRGLIVGTQLAVSQRDQHHHAERRAQHAQSQIQHIDAAQITADQWIHTAAPFTDISLIIAQQRDFDHA